MNVKLIAILSIILLSTTLGLSLTADNSEGTTKFTYDLGTFEYSTTTNTQTIAFHELSNDHAGASTMILSADVRNTLTVNERNMPSWIDYRLEGNATYPKVYLDINPGAVSDSNYSLIFGTGNYDIEILLKVKIIDGGGTIPLDNQYTYLLHFDTMGSISVGSMTAVTTNSSHSFNIEDIKKPTRDNHNFMGWTSVKGSDNVDVRSSWTIQGGASGTTTADTVYAVWIPSEEKPGFTIPSVWDDIIQFFSEPLMLLCLIGGAFCFAVFIRSRR